MRHLTYGRLFVYLFLEYGRSRKAMELGSRIDNQLFAIFITLMSDSGACSRMILCYATATPVSTVPKCRLNSSFRHISAHMSSETWPVISMCET